MKTPYDLSFRVERDHTTLCNKELTAKELKKFRKVCMKNLCLACLSVVTCRALHTSIFETGD